MKGMFKALLISVILVLSTGILHISGDDYRTFRQTETNIPKLLKDLNNKNSLIRQKAVKQLGMLEDPVYITALIKRLKDEHSSVRGEAVKALGQINYNTKRVRDALAGVLKGATKSVRKEAAVLLAKYRDYRAIAPLFKLVKERALHAPNTGDLIANITDDTRALPIVKEALDNEEWQVRRAAVFALVRQDDTENVDIIITLLKHRDLKVREATISLLSRRDNDYRLVKPILQLLVNTPVDKPKPGFFGLTPNQRIASSARETLEKIRDPGAVDLLLDALNHENEKIQVCAARSLIHNMNAKAYERFKEIIKGEALEIKFIAAKELALNGYLPAYEALISVLKSSNPRIQQQAAQILGLSKEKKAINPLIDLLEKTKKEIPDNYRLTKMSAKARAIPSPLERDWNRMLRRTVIDALISINRPECVNYLLKLFYEENFHPRKLIVTYMGTKKEIRALWPLIDRLDDDLSLEIRKEALVSLQKISDATGVTGPTGVTAPTAGLKVNGFDRDSKAWKRWWKKNKLNLLQGKVYTLDKYYKKKIKERYFVGTLKLKDELKYGSAATREQAAVALGNLEDRRNANALIEALNDRNPKVRMAVLGALGKIKSPKAVSALINLLKRQTVDSSTRVICRNALVQLGREFEFGTACSKHTFNTIIKALKVPVLRDTALRILKDISGKEFGDNQKAWREWIKKKNAPPHKGIDSNMKY